MPLDLGTTELKILKETQKKKSDPEKQLKNAEVNEVVKSLNDFTQRSSAGCESSRLSEGRGRRDVPGRGLWGPSGQALAVHCLMFQGFGAQDMGMFLICFSSTDPQNGLGWKEP